MRLLYPDEEPMTIDLSSGQAIPVKEVSANNNGIVIPPSLSSFPSSAWERIGAKLCFATTKPATDVCREAELREQGSQAELGNQSLKIFS